jgi:hypothetical protein
MTERAINGLVVDGYLCLLSFPLFVFYGSALYTWLSLVRSQIMRCLK